MKNKETLEAAADRFVKNTRLKHPKSIFCEGAKWQQEKTIEEVFEWLTTKNYLTDLKETLIKEFKNK